MENVVEEKSNQDYQLSESLSNFSKTIDSGVIKPLFLCC